MADNQSTYKQIGDGLKLTVSAGTAVQFSSTSVPCRTVVVTARPENTDVVVIGSSTVVAAAATRRGISLIPGQSTEIRIADVSSLYLDSVVSGEGVSYAYFN